MSNLEYYYKNIIFYENTRCPLSSTRPTGAWDGSEHVAMQTLGCDVARLLLLLCSAMSRAGHGKHKLGCGKTRGYKEISGLRPEP